jgi:RNA polymerase sigma-70 factor (ECF subfamily)
MHDRPSRQDTFYEQTVADYGPALDRLARSYELDAEKRNDLLQEIHLALWRSFERFAEQCSIRTWIYRVAHNVAASHVDRSLRHRSRGLVSLEEAAAIETGSDPNETVDRRRALGHLYTLIHRLRPIEREVILLYLEGLDAAAIGDITGLSAANVATRVHRIKKLLALQFRKGETNA